MLQLKKDKNNIYQNFIGWKNIKIYLYFTKFNPPILKIFITKGCIYSRKKRNMHASSLKNLSYCENYAVLNLKTKLDDSKSVNLTLWMNGIIIKFEGPKFDLHTQTYFQLVNVKVKRTH